MRSHKILKNTYMNFILFYIINVFRTHLVVDIAGGKEAEGVENRTWC